MISQTSKIQTPPFWRHSKFFSTFAKLTISKTSKNPNQIPLLLQKQVSPAEIRTYEHCSCKILQPEKTFSNTFWQSAGAVGSVQYSSPVTNTYRLRLSSKTLCTIHHPPRWRLVSVTTPAHSRFRILVGWPRLLGSPGQRRVGRYR